MQKTFKKQNHFSRLLIGLVLVSFTLIYSCNGSSSSTDDKKDTMSDSSSKMSTTTDSTMKMSDSSTMKMGADTTKDTTKGGQPTPQGK